MKAVVWSSVSGGLEKNLHLTSTASLPPKAHSLPKDTTLVAVAYTTLNPADYKMPEIPLISSLAFKKPAIPCSDFSGTVVSSTRADLKPGQRVFGISPPPKYGALCEYVVVSGEDCLVPVPDGVNLPDAAAIGVCGGTAYQTIVPYVTRDAKVFINGGSGGVGTFAIQVAKAIGCYVTATCSGPNVELCKKLGADEVINYREENVVDYLKRSSTPFDLLVDYVGTPAIYWSAHHYLKKGCYFITVAGSAKLKDIRAMMAIFLLPRWLGGGQRTPKFVSLQPKASDYTQMVEWMQQGKISTVIEETCDMEHAAAALAKLKLGRTKGKLIVRVRTN